MSPYYNSINNAQKAVIYQATNDIPVVARTALQGTGPEVIIREEYHKYLKKVFEHFLPK